MSQLIRKLVESRNYKKIPTREQCLALLPKKKYTDGRTKQCYRDECDIEKIMHRFSISGTISHLSQFEGVYADFSDFDFHHQTNMLSKGQAVFDALPAELRQEFGQSPAAFFDYVNDPANINELPEKLKGLAAPGQQLPRVAAPDADTEDAIAAPTPTPTATAESPSDPAKGV